MVPTHRRLVDEPLSGDGRREQRVAVIGAQVALHRNDRLAFDAAGIGGFSPFFFERRGKRPDGGEARVAFTMAFAA